MSKGRHVSFKCVSFTPDDFILGVISAILVLYNHSVNGNSEFLSLLQRFPNSLARLPFNSHCAEISPPVW